MTWPPLDHGDARLEIERLRNTTVNPGPGLTGGGDLTADRELAVDFGTAPGTVAAGDDARFGVDGRRQQINARTGAYTVVAADEQKLITVDTVASTVVTLPTGLPVGAWVEVLQLGAGQTTMQAAAGASLLVPTGATAACRGQRCRIVAQVVAADVWALAGDLA